LLQVKGLKKLENFIKKDDEINLWRSLSTREDLEYYDCQMELSQELLKSYTRVERIIGRALLFSLQPCEDIVK